MILEIQETKDKKARDVGLYFTKNKLDFIKTSSMSAPKDTIRKTKRQSTE